MQLAKTDEQRYSIILNSFKRGLEHYSRSMYDLDNDVYEDYIEHHMFRSRKQEYIDLYVKNAAQLFGS